MTKHVMSRACLSAAILAVAACASAAPQPEPTPQAPIIAYVPPIGEACLAVWMIDAAEHLGEVSAQGGVNLEGGERSGQALSGNFGCIGLSPRLGPVYMEAEYQGGNWWYSEAWRVQALCSRGGAIGGEAPDAQMRCERNLAMLG